MKKDLEKGDVVVCHDLKDLHTYVDCLKTEGIEYTVDEKHLKIKIKKNNAKQ